MQKRGGGFPWKWWIVCIFEKKNTKIIIALWFRMILVLLLEVQVHGSTWNQIFKILFRLLKSFEDFWFQLCVPNLMPIFSVLMDWKTVVIYIFFSIFQNGKQSINFTAQKHLFIAKLDLDTYVMLWNILPTKNTRLLRPLAACCFSSQSCLHRQQS